MISNRTADLFDKVKNQREKISLLVVITSINNEDWVFFWFYDSNGNMLKISDLNKFLWQVVQNALSVTNIARSFGIRWEDLLQFDAQSKAFITDSKATNDPRVRSMISTTMQDFYMAMKRGAQYFVGESEHYFNKQGTCFGVIELFNPKYETSNYVKFKDASGQWVSGMVVGFQGSTGEYSISHNGFETDVRENELFPSNIIGASLSFRKKADLITLVQEKERQRQEQEAAAIKTENLQDYPLDSLPEHPQISDIIKDACSQFNEKIRGGWETYGSDVDELAHESYDGFHNHTNGGWETKTHTILYYMNGSGYWPTNPEFLKTTERQSAEAYKDAMEEFIASNRDALVEVGLDPKIKKNLKKINYHDLYEMGQGRLAETLSETESSALSQYEYSFYFKVYYYSPSNRNKEFEDSLPEVFVQSGVEGSYDSQMVEERFSFSTLSQLREKMTSCLNQAVEALG